MDKKKEAILSVISSLILESLVNHDYQYMIKLVDYSKSNIILSDKEKERN